MPLDSVSPLLPLNLSDSLFGKQTVLFPQPLYGIVFLLLLSPMDNVVLSRRDCSLSTLHRSSRAHWYSPSTPMPVLSHCFSTHVQNSSFETHVATHFFLSSAHHQVTPSHLLNTNFTFFDNFQYPSNTFTHVTPFVLILLPYRDLQSWTPVFSLHQPISVVTFFL